jgi:CheY-like chemotaxis protein
MVSVVVSRRSTGVSAAKQGLGPRRAKVDIEEEYTRSSFLAKVCHELRTPLHNIQGLIRVLYKDDTDPAHRYYLRLIRDASNNLLCTINDVLDFSKANTGMLSIENKPFELARVVKDALRTVSSRVNDKPNVELICSYDTEVPNVIFSDAQRIGQILVNLLANAIKFTNAGFVRLEVEASRAGDDKVVVRFAVIDTGIGIPPHEIESIFEPFSQVDITLVRRTHGTGLGLTIVRQLVGLLQGEVGVESSLGQGSTFWFTVSAKTVEPSRPVISSQVSGRSVLIVSKSNHTVALLKDALIKNGVDVRSCEQPPTLSELRMSPSDFVVLTDDVLVEESAWRMVREVIDQRGRQAVLPLLGPGAIKFRQRFHELELPIVLSLPVVSRDIIDALNGSYQPETMDDESFEMEAAAEPLNILIADDIPTNELILRLALEEAGHNVRAVTDGRQLWDVVRPQIERPHDIAARELLDVVLTDVQMPYMDGITVIKKVRALEANSETFGVAPLPLIAVTAHAFPAERERIFAAGATGVVTKPLNPRELERALSCIRRRSEQSTVPDVPQANMKSHRTPQSDVFCEAGATRITIPFLQQLREVLGADVEMIDIEGVYERSGDSARRTLLIFRSFLACYEDFVRQLENNAEGLLTEELGKVAHAIKGMVGEVGANAVYKLAHSLEMFGRNDQRDDLMRGISVLNSDIKRLAAAVQKIVETFDGREGRVEPDSRPPAA